MKYKYTLIYYLKNGQFGINYYTTKEKAEEHLQFYLHNGNYARAELKEVKK